MKQKRIGMLLAWLLLAAMLWGCTPAAEQTPATEPVQTQQPTEPEPTLPPYTCPPDGNPEDVTCLGSYTGEGEASAVVARLEGAELTNGQLNAWYWLTAAQYRLSGAEPQPDWSVPLDVQVYPLDETVASWQQYFLRRALSSWHGARALALQAEAEGVPKEDVYLPDAAKHEKYLQDIPATRFLYGYYENYVPNTMHQAYLDNIPELLERMALELGFADAEAMAAEAAGTDLAELVSAVELYNFSYMYLTTLSYDLKPSEEEIQAFPADSSDEGMDSRVDFRHILLMPEGEISETGVVTASEEAWEACREAAEELLNTWKTRKEGTEAAFADLAYRNSRDESSANSGGAYTGVAREQLLRVLGDWCFDPARIPGEGAVLRSEYGWHLVYFAGIESGTRKAARETLTAELQSGLIAAAREKYPISVSYGDISLSPAEAVLSLETVLYPDVAHERFPEIPLYLQQDYPRTMYGAYPVASYGCGITTMAMLASYQTDDELTVPEMCARFGRYCLSTGTNSAIFENEPAGMGFFLRQRTQKAEEARAALEEGYLVVSLQHKGYWTFGGHFIVMEEITEDGLVRVRDSNIFNYTRLEAHKQDLHDWGCIPPQSSAYWIFEKKVIRFPACARCGDPETAIGSCFVEDYCCEKCGTAQLRRENYLNNLAE